MSIVTFTSDFGTADGYVGAMKGVVLGLAPHAQIVDLTHEIPRHDVAAGAFALAQAAPLFPAGTIHLAVVDPGVGSDRAPVVVEAGGAILVGPDNGLLTLAARDPRIVRRIDAADFRREPLSATFHGRDIFAQTAGRLAAGAHPREAGPLLPDLRPLTGGDAARADDEGVILHIDAFGNLITSFPREILVPGDWSLVLDSMPATFAVRAGRTYADVEVGQPVAYVGSAGLVEIAVREGSAAAQLKARRGQRLRLGRGL